MLTVTQCPYTGPYGCTDTKLPNKGPTVEALKRALGRMGFIAWKGTGYTQLWPHGGELDRGWVKWRKSVGLDASHSYGEQAWKHMRSAKVPKGREHAGEYALDKAALDLIKRDWKEQHVPDEEDFRAALTEYCLLAEANEDAWHYVQYRPVDVTVDPKASYVRADCSSYVIMAYHWAMTKSGLVVPDPSKQGWSGFGNTDYYEDDHPSVLSGQYLVGDLAHYPGHVTICRKAGTSTTSIFSSHGQEAGPMPTQIHYRPDFRKVVRPPLK